MDVLMPQLGETVTEGTVAQWFKAVGDTVAAGEALFEIETDKTSMEVEATQAGVLAEIRVEAGRAVPVGTAIAVIAAPGEVLAPADKPAKPVVTAQAAPAPAAPMTASAPAPAAGASPTRRPAGPPPGFGPYSEVRTPAGRYGGASGPRGLRVTPLARRLAAQRGIDLAAIAEAVSAAGRRRIARADILAAAPSGAGASAAPRQPTPSAGTDADVVALNRIRRTTGAHLSRSWSQVPHVFQAVEADFARVERVRRALNAENAERWGFRLTYLPFIARAVCLAIRAFPQVNASIDGDRLLVHRRVNLGIAVDLSHDGLIVPVVHGAEDYNLVGLARALNEAAGRARSGKLSEDDLKGGTYTISNSGSFGTLFTAPIVNAPQVAILSSDGVAKRPVVVEDEVEGDRIAIHPIGIVGQSFDHRAFDGAYSAAFLAKVKAIIESRDWIADAA